MSNSISSSSDEARIKRLEALVQEIQDIVNGTAAEGYEDGLVYRVEELERIVKELEVKDHVLYDTTTNWNAQRSLQSEKGYIYIYSDAKEYEGTLLPRFKVGDGNAYLIDIPFMDQDIVDYLERIVTVTQEEKDKWNEKVRCYVNPNDASNLIFTTD